MAKTCHLLDQGLITRSKCIFQELHYRGEYIGSGQAEDVIYADGVMNGKKVGLRGSQGTPSASYKLSLGDYQARFLKDPYKRGNSEMFQVYEVVLPDRTIWRCTITGIWE